MRRHLITLAVAGVMLAGSIAGSTTAWAAKPVPDTAGSASSCPTSNFCVWYLRYYNAPMYRWVGSDSDWTNNHFSNGAIVNDNDESWANHGVPCTRCDRVRVFRDIHYGGGVTISLARGQQVPYNPGAEDRGSSHYWY